MENEQDPLEKSFTGMIVAGQTAAIQAANRSVGGTGNADCLG